MTSNRVSQESGARDLGDRKRLEKALQARLLTIVSRHDSPSGVPVEVRDIGSGLDPQRIEQVFEAFYTAKADGIGLSISRFIVEAHGRRLWACPTEPHGAVILLMLPVARAEGHP
jgi:signal transduction histidine kinase